MPGLVRVTRREWLHLTAAGSAAVVQVPRGSGQLEALQRAVGGLIEPIRLGHGCTLWVNEEGRLRGLPLNEIATAVLAGLWERDPVHGGTPSFVAVVGDAVLEVRS